GGQIPWRPGGPGGVGRQRLGVRDRFAQLGSANPPSNPGAVPTRNSEEPEKVLQLRGVNKFQVRIVTCTPRKHIKSWRKLERALLLQFKKMLGEVPRCNVQGKGMRWTNESDFFRLNRQSDVIDDLS